ncbi:hypothetical protein ACWEQ8_30170 [Streptomyces noursei]
MATNSRFALQIDGVEVAAFHDVTRVGSGFNTKVITTNTKDGITKHTTVITGKKEPEPVRFTFFPGEPGKPDDKKNLQALQNWQKEGDDQPKRKNISILEYHDGKVITTDSYLEAFVSEITPGKTGEDPYTGTIVHNGANEGAK